MQVSDVDVASILVEPPYDVAAAKPSNSNLSMGDKDVFLCSFDWSHMFEVEEKLLKIGQLYRKLAQGIGEADELIKAAVRSCRSDISVSQSCFGEPKRRVTCTIRIDSVQVAVADGKSFKRAEKAAFSKAASTLSRPYLQVLREPCLVGSDEPITRGISSLFPDDTISAINKFRSEWKGTRKTKQGQLTASWKGDGDDKKVTHSQTGGSRIRTRAIYQMPSKQSVLQFSELVIIRQQDSSMQTSMAKILKSSAKLCDKKLRFSEELLSSGRFHCMITVGEQVIGDAISDKQKEARSAAVEAALTKSCTILVKDMKRGCPRNVITPQQLLTDEVQLNIIPESNIGCKLLKKMGWTGGGLVPGGATNPAIFDGRSISTDKTGFGFKKKVPNPLDVLQRLFADYKRTHQLEDLIFSPDISKEVQAIIEKEAAMHGLQVSYCDSDQQSKPYIIVSWHRSIAELVQHIRANGGETQRYVLIEAKAGSDSHLKLKKDEILDGLESCASSFSVSDCHTKEEQLTVIESVSPVLRCFERQSTSVTERKKSASSIFQVGSKSSEEDTADLLCISGDSLPKFEESTLDPVIKVDDNTFAGSSEKPITGISVADSVMDYKKLLHGTVKPSHNVQAFDPSLFVIILCRSLTSVGILDVSSKLCGMKVGHQISQVNNKKFTCSITIAEQTVGTGIGKTQISAKVAATDKALNYLSQVCYTLIVKDLSNCKVLESAITPSQLKKQVRNENTSAGDGSIVNDLKKKALDLIISVYCDTPHHEDIVFSPNFSSSYLNHVKLQAKERDLTLFRFGEGGELQQFFGLSRKRTPVELVQFVEFNGGKTIRFALIDPQSKIQSQLHDCQKPTVIGPVLQSVTVGHTVEVAAFNNKSMHTEKTLVNRKSTEILCSSISMPNNDYDFERHQLLYSAERNHEGEDVTDENSSSSFVVVIKGSKEVDDSLCAVGNNKRRVSSKGQRRGKFDSLLKEFAYPCTEGFTSADSMVSLGAVSPDYCDLLLLDHIGSCESSESFDLGKLVIVKSALSGDGMFSSISILNTSAKLCGMMVAYILFPLEDNMFRCSISLSGESIGSEVGLNEYSAQHSAARMALSYLSHLCPSLIFNDRPRVVSDLLITPDHVIGQDEAGLSKETLDQVLSAYTHNPNHDHLVFSGFRKKARKFIISEGATKGLDAFHFTGENIFSLSIHRSLHELVAYVRSNGGETIHYKIVEPK